MNSHPDRWSYIKALGIALTIALLHSIAAWGHVGALGGDTMRWLHEVERYAGGERVYLDFIWIFPPLAMWLFGGVARVFGPDLIVIWLLSTLVFLAVVIVFVTYASRMVDRDVLPWVVGAGLTLAIALAHNLSSPLPVGMYIPAAPVGALLLLVALVGTLDLYERITTGALVTVGVAAAGCVLTKQDFWVTAAVLMVASALRTLRTGSSGERVRSFVLLGLACVVPLGIALGLLVNEGGLRIIPAIMTGFGAASVGLGRSAPGIERLVLQVGVLASLVASVCLVLWFRTASRPRALAFALGASSVVATIMFGTWIVQALRIGLAGADLPAGLRTPLQLAIIPVSSSADGALGRAGFTLLDQVVKHVLPIMVPFGMLGVTLVRRKAWLADGVPVGKLILVLAVCVAARARRGFEFTEWYQVMLEVPAIVLFGKAALRRIQLPMSRVTRDWLALVWIGALLAYWHMGTGWFTQRGRGEAIETVRGRVWLTAESAREFTAIRAALDSIDPQRKRPLFATPRSATHNYLLGRRSASPLTFGFRYRFGQDVDSLIVALSSADPPLLILHHPDNLRPSAPPSQSLWPWERWPIRHAPVDADRVEQLLRRCRSTAAAPGIVIGEYVITDCVAQGVGTP